MVDAPIPARRPPRTADIAARALIVGGGAVAAFALAIALTRPWSMLFWPTAGYLALVAALATSILLTGFAARARRDARSRAGPVFRGVLCFAVLASVPWFVFFQPFKALWLLMYAGVAAGVFAASWAAAPAIARRTPAGLRRAATLTTFNLCLLAVLGELGLRTVAIFDPSPVFDTGGSPGSIFARFRKRPGELHLGLRCDERGFNDELAQAPGTRLVACVGDSFSFGLVPRPFHYTSVAERELERVEIYNAGVIAAGPAEYLRLLREDVLPLRPDLVVVSVFVGNDVEEAYRFAARWWRSALDRVFDREHLLIWSVPRRLARIEAERRRRGGDAPAGAIQGDDARAIDADPAALRARFPWLDDPSLEHASMSDEVFVDVERRRAAFACAPEQDAAYGTLFDALDAIRVAAGATPIAFVLIPDEFQVEDALWERVRGDALERDLPQARIGEWMSAHDLPFVDLLPTLRAVPPLEDGDRHLYHRRDTHWNRRGNEAAGRAVAAFIRAQLPR